MNNDEKKTRVIVAEVCNFLLVMHYYTSWWLCSGTIYLAITDSGLEQIVVFL